MNMKIKIKAFATLRNLLGKEHIVELGEDSRVKDLLDRLCAENKGIYSLLFDSDGLKDEINILVNGKNISALNGIQTKLENEDEIALFPAAIGG
jgi:molybdopterin synthase sulfur carrier subunit